MDKFKEIRPIVLGLVINNNKILVEEKKDTKKGNTFYRCLGGGIEFTEKSEDAIKREFLEEINATVEIQKLLDVVENIFEFNGKKAHELIFIYKIDICKEDYKEEYLINDTAGNFKAKWISIQEFKNNNKILYPKEIFKYI